MMTFSWNTVKYSVGSLLLAIAAGTVLMIVVYGIPIQPIRQHVTEASSIYSVEGDYYKWSQSNTNTVLDNFTDALMLNEASFIGTGDIIADAMNNPYIRYNEMTESQQLMQAISVDTVEDSAFIVNYARYWHGSLVFLKPLLLFLTVSDIRVLNMAVQMILLLFLLIEAYKAGGYGLSLSILMAMLCLNPITTALCIQLSDIYIITMLGGLVMLRQRRNSDIWHVFLWIGIATAFLDLLTYPMVGLGIVLLIYLYLHREDALHIQLKRIVGCSISWGGGYAGMWLGKWLVATVLTGNNVFLDGYRNVLYRSTGNSSNEVSVGYGSALDVIYKNAKNLLTRSYKLVFLICLLILVLAILVRLVQIHIVTRRVIPYIIVGMYPIIWYCVLQNHSWVHSWMTQRELVISVFAICIVFADACKVNAPLQVLPVKNSSLE